MRFKLILKESVPKITHERKKEVKEKRGGGWLTE
jgi:hypothetical protein